MALTIEKKTIESLHRLPDIISDLLWDTPRSGRIIDEQTRPVLLRRAVAHPLPERTAREWIRCANDVRTPRRKRPSHNHLGNDSRGVLFGDGIEEDSVEFLWGSIAEITVSAKRLRLVKAPVPAREMVRS